MKKSTGRNSFLLLLTACIWGLAFVSQSKGMEYMHPFTFNAARFLIGTAALAVYLLVRRLGQKENTVSFDKKITIQAGILCGVALTIASTLQQFGIKETTVGKAGFITTLYIIFVPIAGILFKKKVPVIVWFSAIMAAAGMYLLCMTESLTVSSGDILVFLSAIFFTVHILIIDHFSAKADGALMSCIQFGVCGGICSVGALLWGGPSVGQLTSGMGTLLYAGVLSCGLAYTLQIVGQKDMNPTIAALILSLESVVATIAGFVAFKIGFLTEDQSMTARQITGCVIVFAAVVLVQLPVEGLLKRHKKREISAE